MRRTLVAVIMIVIVTIITSWIATRKRKKTSNTIKERSQRKSKGERRCQETLEEIFGKPFINLRPEFLENPETGRCLELDCYNEELRLAIEYNGKQHYVFPNGFHNKIEQFIAQVRRDDYKKRVCKDNNITLIIVPYTVKIGNIRDFIIKELEFLKKRKDASFKKTR